MNAFKLLRTIYLCHFSKPVADRELYRTARKQKITSIVEIGLGQMARTRRLLEMVAEKTPLEQVRFAGVDLFEARDPSLPGVALKQAHNELRPLVGKLQLVPGDVFSALARSANSLAGSDLVIIGSAADAGALAKAWFYLPRMLHDRSIVYLEEPGENGSASRFRLLKRLEIEQLASTAARSLRRAA